MAFPKVPYLLLYYLTCRHTIWLRQFQGNSYMLMISPLPHKDIIQSEPVLTNDLLILFEYFISWLLCPSYNKTEVSCFYLSTNQTNVELKLNVDDRILHHNPFPKYLGITMDRTLSFRKHMENTAAKACIYFLGRKSL